MRKHFAILISTLLCNIILSAQPQSPAGKLGATLKLLLADTSSIPALEVGRFITEKNNKKTIAVLIETSSANDADYLRKKGYFIRTSMGNISTADVTAQEIKTLATSPFIRRIELPLLLRKTDTTMRRITTVEEVLKGKSPLSRPYTGKNVLIGIIDDGIDISHPDFYDNNGHIRISHLWNMDNGQNINHQPVPPAGFNYGTEWKSDSLEYYAKRFKNKGIGIYPMQALFGNSFHGTSVTSLAAGNDGVAPDAEIVSVALTATVDTLLRSDRVIDAIMYIYRIANQQKKKCIINISLGTQAGGPHDGKTLLEKAIDNFSYECPDLLVCVSAGNDGNNWKHWGGFPVGRDSSFGFFICTYKASLYFSIPRHDSKNLRISIGESKFGSYALPNINKDSVYYQSPFLNIDSLINNQSPTTFKSLLPNGNLSSFITFTASHYNDDYDELIITTDERTSTTANPFDTHLYRFVLKGEGTVHAWYPFLNLHPLFYFNNNPYPNDSTYHNTDNEFSTGIPSNAFTVISSGAYNLRSCYVNMKGKVVSQYEKCRTTYFTSHGPTLDGRIKPDILAPGDNVFAARSRFQDYMDFESILDANTVSFGGTSASSPITAGVAALIWEKYPFFTRDSIINLIKSSANFDSYCAVWGEQPNNIAGWGKIDAFYALTGERIDNNSFCRTNDVCVPKFQPQDTIPSLPKNEFIIYPNPVFKTAYIHYSSDRVLRYAVFDVSGRIMKKGMLPKSTGFEVKLDFEYYAQGIYYLKIEGWEKPFVKKIVVAGQR